MSRRLWLAVALMLALTRAAAAADTVGLASLAVPDAGSGRPLELSIWYPASAPGAQTVMVGENPAFVGVAVVPDAPPVEGTRPLVLLSHGHGGNHWNQSWLATRLARAGYLVVSLDHPGTSTWDKRPEQAARVWERPRDISRAIDALLADPVWSPRIAAGRIAVAGHSFGGWVAMELAGARMRLGRLDQDCRSHPDLAGCTVRAKIGTTWDAADEARIAADLRDTRVRAIVSLDLGLARGFDPAELALIEVPTLVIAAGIDVAQLPAALESHWLADHLQPARSRYVEIADAQHFSFLGLCKPGAPELIEAHEPGEGIVCRDVGARDRAAIHQQTAELVLSFLAEVLPAE